MSDLPAPAPDRGGPAALRGVRGWRRPSADVCLVVAFAAAGFFIGVAYLNVFRATGQPNDFAQSEFGAAVAMACGHGFSDPGPDASAALSDFLRVRRDALSCTDLPPTTHFGPPTFSQGLYRYLLETAAIVWKVRGISWSGLWPLFGLAYAITLVSAYGLFRLGMRPPIAAGVTLLLAMSAVNLGHIVYLRDYAKAPFILLLMLIAAWLARVDRTDRQRRWLSAVFGVTVGIGFGFRNDLLILLPPFAAIVALRFGGLRRRNVLLRLQCLGMAAAGFFVAAWPLVLAYSRGSNNGHVILLGFMTSFDGPLGVRESLYDWGYAYSDGYIATLADSFSVRTTGASVPYVSAAYDKALMSYIGEIVRNFPADIVTRAYSSAMKVFDLPFAAGVHTNAIPFGIHAQWLVGLYQIESVALQVLKGSGAWMVAASLVVIAASDVAGALLLTVFVLYFAGYPAIQFHVRHFFHLEFITWWACGFLLQSAWVASRSSWRQWNWIGVRRAAAFAALATLMVLGPLVGLRAYQNRHVRELLSRYQSAAQERIEVRRETPTAGEVLFTAPELWNKYEGAARQDVAVETEYLTMTLLPAGCDSAAARLQIRYEPFDNLMAQDLTRQLTVPLRGGTRQTSMMFAAFWKKGWTRFSGIQMSAADAGCFGGLSRTVDLEGLSLALNALYVPDWRSRTLYQTIADWEKVPGEEQPAITFLRGPFSLEQRFLEGPLLPPGPAAFHSPITRQSADGSWILRGMPETPTGYLIQYAPTPATEESVLVVEGTVARGGITIGFQESARWAGYVNILNTGRFLALLKPAAAGEYTVTIADSPTGSVLESRAKVAGWLRNYGLWAPPTEIVISRLGWSR